MHRVQRELGHGETSLEVDEFLSPSIARLVLFPDAVKRTLIVLYMLQIDLLWSNRYMTLARSTNTQNTHFFSFGLNISSGLT